MKKIEATIKPSELKDVEDALDAIGIRSFSAQKIQRHGAASRRSERLS